MNKSHSLRETPQFATNEAVTFCGKRGWKAKSGSSEYETVLGGRFEIDQRKPTCQKCNIAMYSSESDEADENSRRYRKMNGGDGW